MYPVPLSTTIFYPLLHLGLMESLLEAISTRGSPVSLRSNCSSPDSALCSEPVRARYTGEIPQRPATPEPSDAQIGVLGNPDILKQILEHFSDPDADKPPKILWLWAGLTSTSFLDPALDLIWESMQSLLPFFRVLKPFTSVEGFEMLHGPIDESDWDRFDYYSRRLKSLVRSSDNHQVSPTTFLRLARERREALFPTLRSIHYVNTAHQKLDALLLLSPSVERLELDEIHKDNEATLALLSMLNSETPMLSHLRLNGSISTFSVRFVMRLAYLRSLHLINMGRIIDQRVMLWLSNLSDLNELTLDLRNSSVEPPSCGFASLRHLKITALLSFIQTFLTNISSIRMEGLDLVALPKPAPPPVYNPWHHQATPVPEPQTQEWIRCSQFIVSRWSSSLRAFGAQEGEVYRGIMDILHIFSSLLDVGRLERFEVKQFCNSSPLADHHYLNMASSWKRLKTLHIHVPYVTSSQFNGPTIETLKTLSETCPDLKSLEIFLNLNPMPALANTIDISCHRLERLAFGNFALSTDDISTLARRLDHLFPHLKRVKAIDTNTDISRSWDRVEKIVRVCQAVRSDERHRMVVPRRRAQPNAER